MTRKFQRRTVTGPDLTTGQAASICCVSTRTVGKWFDEGHLEGYRINGNDRRIYRTSLVAYLRKIGHVQALERLGTQRGVLAVGCADYLLRALRRALPDLGVITALGACEAASIFREAAVNAALVHCHIGHAAMLDCCLWATQQDGVRAVVALLPDDQPTNDTLARAGVTCLPQSAPPAEIARALGGASPGVNGNGQVHTQE